MILGSLLGLFVPTTPRIVGVSMFKNGYAVVTREIATDRPGEYAIGALPQGSLGTLWFTASGGARLDSVETVTRQTTEETPVANLDELLRENVGRQVSLALRDDDGVLGKKASGKLLSASAELVILETESGTVAISKASVASVSIPGNTNYKTSRKGERRELRVRVSGNAGKVTMVSLERGVTWAPGYAVDITDKKTLRLTAKATVLNDLEDLKNVEARFITGFPNVPFASLVDPLVSGRSVDEFIGLLGALGTSGAGGFGSAPRARDMLTQNAYAPAAPTIGTGMPVSPLMGAQMEDLFFYRQPDVDLAKGGRAYYVLFRAEAPYDEVYTWDVEDPVANGLEYGRPGPAADPVQEVWHALRFRNTSGQPLTTAAATTFSGGEILGQDMMSYVPAGGDAELRITKALDIRAEMNEEEVSRERGAVKENEVPRLDLVTLRGTYALTNAKAVPVKVRVRRNYTGELVTADHDPKITRTAKGLRDLNPTGRLIWNGTIEPGKTLTLTATFHVYVRSQ